jgi:hypothetical protein
MVECGLAGALSGEKAGQRMIGTQLNARPGADTIRNGRTRTGVARALPCIAGELTTMPETRNVKALVNHEYHYRLRIGNYRMFFNFDGAVRIIYIEEVRKRDDHTY